MNFFCSSTEFNTYAEENGLHKDTIVKVKIEDAIQEAKNTFHVPLISE